MSAPYSEELAEAARDMVHQIVYGVPGSTKTTEALLVLVRSLARYTMAQEDNVTVAVPEDTEDEQPPDAPLLPHDFDLMGLIKAAKKAAAVLKDVPGQGYPAEELWWYAEQVESQMERPPEEQRRAADKKDQVSLLLNAERLVNILRDTGCMGHLPEETNKAVNEIDRITRKAPR